MKKRTIILLAVMDAFLFEIAIILVGIISVWYLIHKVSLFGVCIVLAITMLIDFFAIWFMGYLNRSYDVIMEYIGYQKTLMRWSRSLLFAGLITIYCIAALSLWGHRVEFGLGERVVMIEGILFVAIVLAIVMYFLSYRKTTDVGVRISDLMYQNVENQQRRYSLLVQEANTVTPTQQSITGNLDGEIHLGDTVYIYEDTNKVCCGKVIGLKDEKDTRQEMMEDNPCVIILDGIDHPIEPYAVMSDIVASNSRKEVNHTENPYLVGLLYEYDTKKTDPIYMKKFLSAVLHGTYIVVGTTKAMKHRRDIVDAVTIKMDVAFPLVSLIAKKKDQDKSPVKTSFPLFTDWESARRWKSMMKNPEAITILADFSHILSFMETVDNGCVINPFGPVSFNLTEQHVREIMTSDDYQTMETYQEEEENDHTEDVR